MPLKLACRSKTDPQQRQDSPATSISTPCGYYLFSLVHVVARPGDGAMATAMAMACCQFSGGRFLGCGNVMSSCNHIALPHKPTRTNLSFDPRPVEDGIVEEIPLPPRHCHYPKAANDAWQQPPSGGMNWPKHGHETADGWLFCRPSPPLSAYYWSHLAWPKVTLLSSDFGFCLFNSAEPRSGPDGHRWTLIFCVLLAGD